MAKNSFVAEVTFNVSLKIRVPLKVKISICSGMHRAVFKIHTGQVTGCILHFTSAYVKKMRKMVG